MKRLIPFLCGGLVVLCLGASLGPWWEDLDKILIRLDAAQAWNMNEVRSLQVRVRLLEEWKAALESGKLTMTLQGDLLGTNMMLVWTNK